MVVAIGMNIQSINPV